ncbi:putative RNA-binding protein (virulence factor B family) [Sporosarcina luteola]|nr:putative RNA-binding protein (virulence factor B family) [Sporosarcina luteola]
MEQLQSGYMTTLDVLRSEGSRYVLDGHGTEILLNASEVEASMEAGDQVDVFLYKNRRGELAATTNIPNMTCGTFGWGRVLRVDGQEGVYVDIGSSFEVLINRADLPRLKALWPQTNDELFMTLRTDLGGTIFGRLATEERVQELIANAPASLRNQNLKARAYRLLPVGSFLLTQPDLYRIFIHQTEREHEPRLGEEVDVRIIGIREDGTLNGSLMPRKQDRLGDDAQAILDYMNEVGGKMPFGDKSSPEEIQEMFGMSKAAFKRALGKLMKERRVSQEDGWTHLQ